MVRTIGCGEMCIQCGLSPRAGDDVQLVELHKDGTVEPSICEFLCFDHRQRCRRKGYIVVLMLEGPNGAA